MTTKKVHKHDALIRQWLDLGCPPAEWKNFGEWQRCLSNTPAFDEGLEYRLVLPPTPGDGSEIASRMKTLATNWCNEHSQPVRCGSRDQRELFALIDHVCIGVDSPPAPKPKKEIKTLAWSDGETVLHVKEGGWYSEHWQRQPHLDVVVFMEDES